MKPLYLTFLITLQITLLTASGCASIAKILPWGDKDPEAEYADDPVAAAAMRLRSPASSVAPVSDEGSAWSRRYSAPVAETISYGMNMDEVAAVWGEPNSVDSAGDSQSGNQRWTYFSGLSSRYGLGTKRIVYFENGKVAGWKK